MTVPQGALTQTDDSGAVVDLSAMKRAPAWEGGMECGAQERMRDRTVGRPGETRVGFGVFG